MRRIRTAGKKPDFLQRAYNVRQSLEDFKQRMEVEFMKRTEGWQPEHKPEISSYVIISGDAAILTVYVKGNAEMWERVSTLGAEPRIIVPRPERGPKAMLRFPFQGRGASYTPHTTVGGGWGGSGEKHGPPTTFYYVNWPGFEPRHFEEKILAENIDEFRKEVSNALRRKI